MDLCGPLIFGKHKCFSLV